MARLPVEVARLLRVKKSLGGRPVLDGLDLKIASGTITALLGPNGAGKTTAVGIMTGRLASDAGSAFLFGLSPGSARARRRMGVMLQSAGLPETLTVAEQVSLFSGYYARPRPVAETLRLSGLEGFERRRCQALSGGQQRRLQFALAICGRPDLLILDEPTSGLDHEARRALWSVIRDEADAGAAVLVTTHHLDEAEALADRIVVMNRGRIIADGTPAQIKATVAGSTIRCRTRVSAEALSALRSVVSVVRAGNDVVLTSNDAVSSVGALLDIAQDLTDLTIRTATLEEAFAVLTHTDIPEAL